MAERREESSETAASRQFERMVDVLQYTIVAIVRRDGPDLSARQLGVFLLCYLSKDAQTVRGLAAILKVSKPAISRVLDRLGELGLIRRKPDPADGRSVIVQRTLKGAALLRDLRSIMHEVNAVARKTDAARRKAPWQQGWLES